MANNADNIVVGVDGKVYTAPYSGSLVYPTNVSTALNAAFEEVGFISEDGVNLTIGSDSTDIGAWQSFYSVRTIKTGESVSVSFACREFNRESVGLAWGGGTFSVAGGVATYTPPAPADIDRRALVLEWEDGGAKFRLVVPRGIATGDVGSNVNRTSALDLPINFTANPKGDPVEGELGTQPYYLLSNAEQLVEAGS